MHVLAEAGPGAVLFDNDSSSFCQRCDARARRRAMRIASPSHRCGAAPSHASPPGCRAAQGCVGVVRKFSDRLLYLYYN